VATERLEPDQLDEFPDHLARYAFAMQHVSGKRVLDLGCGVGYGAGLMTPIASSVHGIDISEDAIETARATYPAATFEVADLFSATYPQVDVVTCFEVLEHVKDPEALIDRASRALVPGGTLLASTPNADHWLSGYSGNPFHLKEMSWSELEGVLSPYFSTVTPFYQGYHLRPTDGVVQWSLNALRRQWPDGKFSKKVGRLGRRLRRMHLSGGPMRGELMYPVRAGRLIRSRAFRRVPEIWLAVAEK
jgi:SAM-dependent methyltransferase